MPYRPAGRIYDNVLLIAISVVLLVLVVGVALPEAVPIIAQNARRDNARQGSEGGFPRN